MSARNEDFLFAQEAQNKGYVTEAQVEEGFLLQKRMAEELKIDERLAVILVKRGWMAEDQARRVYALIEPEGKRVKIEGYRLVDRLGRGSMGTVYKAVHQGLHRIVAIKVLRRELLAEKVHTERLKNEARMLADLEHPHIVRALDAGESNGFPYVVMEYVEGETLKDLIARRGALPEEEALHIARGIGDALEKARRMGIVHRDVKPGNILISTRGVAKLMDLGLAKGPVDMELTQHGATVGTPQFMAPEQVEEAGGVDCRSDIYSLGATMYAMLTGRPPFTGAAMAEILNKVLNEQAIPIRARSKGVSPEVSYLVERMMLKDPSLRYQTPSEVVEHIDRILGGQSIIPDGFKGNWEGYLLKERLRRRNRRLRVVGAIVLVAAVGGWLVADYSRKKGARTRAESTLDQIATVSADNENMGREDLAQKIERLRGLRRELIEHRRAGGLGDALPPIVDVRLQRLERYAEHWRTYDELIVETDTLVRQQRFGTAHAKLAEFKPTCTDFPALRKLVGQRQAAVAGASAIAVNAIVAQAQQLAASDIVEYARAFRARSAQLQQGDFVERPHDPGRASPLEASRGRLKALAAQLEVVRDDFVSFERAYAGAAVEEQIRSGVEVGPMRRQIADAAADVKRRMALSLRPESWVEGFARQPIMQLVEGDLEARIEAYERAVRAWGARELTAIRTLVRNGELDAGRRRLEALVVSARGSYFGDLKTLADALLGKVTAQIQERDATSETLTRDSAQGVAERLRRGELVRARKLIEEALQDPSAEGAARAKLLGLRHGPRAVAAVWSASMDYLGGRGKDVKLEDVPVYADDTLRLARERLRIRSVDRVRRRLAIGVYVKGRGYVDREIELHRIPFEQHLTWARLAGGSAAEIGEIEEALVRLFDEAVAQWGAVRDLPPVIQKLSALAKVFDRAAGLEIWSELTYDVLDRVVRPEQNAREIASRGLRTLGAVWMQNRDFVPAMGKFREWLDPQAPWRFTEDFAQYEHHVRKWLAECEAEAAKREIETWLQGFRAAEVSGEADGPSDRTRIRCDFDIPICLRKANFPFGYGYLVSEEGSVVTPGGAARERFELELLHGVEGLMRGRPLALYSMFDPAQPIQMAFDLDTRRGAFFLAVDLDGVQLGVLSADPNWFPSWRLPESVRQGDGPLVDFYGRGRGIAWRHGIDFGSVVGPQSGWSWEDAQRGRHHPRWAKLGEGSGRQFAFRPGHRYRVKVIRDRDRITLHVADLRRYRAVGDPAFAEVFTRRDSDWRGTGATSELDPSMRRGSGKLQILSWSTVRIDNLELVGRVREGWKQAQRAAAQEAAARAAEEQKK